MNSNAPFDQLAESPLAYALLLSRLDAGPGVTPRLPDVPSPSPIDWLEQLLRAVERRASHIASMPKSKSTKAYQVSINTAHARSALDLCQMVRNACTVDAAVPAAMAALMAVSQLWKAEYVGSLGDNARKAGKAAAAKKAISRIKEHVRVLWFKYFVVDKKPWTSERFVMEVQRLWPNELKSSRVVLRWCTAWRKEASRMVAPAG